MWYEARTNINNREPLFHRYKALTLFAAVFRETGLRFSFTIRGTRIEEDRAYLGGYWSRIAEGEPEAAEGEAAEMAGGDRPPLLLVVPGVRPCPLHLAPGSVFAGDRPLPPAQKPLPRLKSYGPRAGVLHPSGRGGIFYLQKYRFGHIMTLMGMN